MDELSQYDYTLPDELIARQPPPAREDARLLVVDRSTRSFAHHGIRDLPTLLSAGDILVLNDTRVLPARLFGRRARTGGKWEGLFLGTTAEGLWKLIGHTRGHLQPGEEIAVEPAHGAAGSETLRLTLVAREDEGVWLARPEAVGDPAEILAQFGTMPLPPYIERKRADAVDWQRYQTVFSKRPGAVAAPTAGLHFTPELLAACRDRGIDTAEVTLHVGIGTFRPVAVERLSEHVMHAEWCEISEPAAAQLRETRHNGGRIVAVGTTSVRTLESAAHHHAGELHGWQGDTRLFIRPPYQFRAVDALLTNFHLPRSTLLVLVSALAGVELIRAAYEEAVRERYRFFSYGDAMLIV